MTQSTVERSDNILAVDERNLVERAKSGDQSAFRVIMEQHNRQVYPGGTRCDDGRHGSGGCGARNISKCVLQSLQFPWRFVACDLADAHRCERSAWAQTQATSNGDRGKRRKGQETNAQIVQFPTMNTRPIQSALQRNAKYESFWNAQSMPFRNPFAWSSSCATLKR